MNKVISVAILSFFVYSIPSGSLWARYYHQPRTGTGRNRRMMQPLSYRHTWDRSDRWFNNRWWDIQAFPRGLNQDPDVNQYSDLDCPECY